MFKRRNRESLFKIYTQTFKKTFRLIIYAYFLLALIIINFGFIMNKNMDINVNSFNDFLYVIVPLIFTVIINEYYNIGVIKEKTSFSAEIIEEEKSKVKLMSLTLMCTIFFIALIPQVTEFINDIIALDSSENKFFFVLLSMSVLIWCLLPYIITERSFGNKEKSQDSGICDTNEINRENVKLDDFDFEEPNIQVESEADIEFKHAREMNEYISFLENEIRNLKESHDKHLLWRLIKRFFT